MTCTGLLPSRSPREVRLRRARARGTDCPWPSFSVELAAAVPRTRLIGRAAAVTLAGAEANAARANGPSGAVTVAVAIERAHAAPATVLLATEAVTRAVLVGAALGAHSVSATRENQTKADEGGRESPWKVTPPHGCDDHTPGAESPSSIRKKDSEDLAQTC